MTGAPLFSDIGGYFGLERASGDGLPWLRDAIGYVSARSAIAAFVGAFRPHVVWVPYFICGAVMQALSKAGAQVRRYVLDACRGVPVQVDIEPGDLLICVDYFGVSAPAVESAISRFGPAAVLVDASQSLFFKPCPGSATVYSPRKFLGIPDGGLLLSTVPVPPRLVAEESESVSRAQHLLYRLAGLIESGHEIFRHAEMSLVDCAPLEMSRITKALLWSASFEAIAARRLRNYGCLASLLGEAGFEVPDLSPGAVPLCCPVHVKAASTVRAALVSKHIFTPTYWPDAEVPEYDSEALTLRDCTVYLPCDQRYGDSEMRYVARTMIRLAEGP